MVLDFEFYIFYQTKSDHRFGTLLHFFPQNLSNQMAGLMVNFSNTTVLDIGNLKKEKMDFEILFEKCTISPKVWLLRFWGKKCKSVPTLWSLFV